MAKIFDELMERGYVEQITHEELKDTLNNEHISFYIGIDPTADSLHVGHFMSLIVASRMQKQVTNLSYLLVVVQQRLVILLEKLI